MKTKAAVLYGLNEKWQIEEVELDPPNAKEVLVKLTASGLCHSDEHLVTGDIPMPVPDHRRPRGRRHRRRGRAERRPRQGRRPRRPDLPAVLRPLLVLCSTGMQNLCDLGQFLIIGPQLRRHLPLPLQGRQASARCACSARSPSTPSSRRSRCVKVDDDIPLDKAALVGCGVTTGWGTAVRTAEIQPGDTVVVIGIGGIGINAVQGAGSPGRATSSRSTRSSSSATKALEFGATHAAASVEEARPDRRRADPGRRWPSRPSSPPTSPRATYDRPGPRPGRQGRHGRRHRGRPPEPTTQISGSFELTLMQKQLRGLVCRLVQRPARHPAACSSCTRTASSSSTS